MIGKLGEWVEGRQYPETCVDKISTGCCENKNLTYRFYNDEINNIDAKALILEKLSNKNLTILGDSLMYEMFKKLCIILGEPHVELYREGR